MYDYIKLYVSVEMTDKSKDVSIFPRKQIGSVNNTFILDALRLFAKITGKEDPLNFLNKCISVGPTERYIGSCL